MGARLADRVYLVKDDNVQLAVVAPLLVLSLSIREEGANVLLALPNVLAEHLRPVDDLRLLA